MSREIKRVVSQFLNGLAIAIVSMGVLAPLSNGTLHLMSGSLAFAVALALHGAALTISGR